MFIYLTIRPDSLNSQEGNFSFAKLIKLYID